MHQDHCGPPWCVLWFIYGSCATQTYRFVTRIDGKPNLLLYSALTVPPFRTIKLRARSRTCAACGDDGEKFGDISKQDYVAFCGGARPDWEHRGLEDGEEGKRMRATVSTDSLFFLCTSHRIVSKICRSFVMPCNTMMGCPR